MIEFSGFSPATQAWLAETFAAPTPVQQQAWETISRGKNTLVVAPTGSGKTLAAFLWSIDQLIQRSAADIDPAKRCRVLYISPLKALAVDIDRNLTAPLKGVRQTAARLGKPTEEITVTVRTGDTPPTQRRAFFKQPSDILITTPESLFLLLTSAAREALTGVDTVIVDEVHAVCGSKRGVHLALSLERLDALLARPAQRIGLSATVRPVEEVAQFLGGARPVTVVQPRSTKTLELTVEVPVEDMAALPEVEPTKPTTRTIARTSLWPPMEERIYQLVTEHRSTIIFVNSRRVAERLCANLNDLAAQDHPDDPPVLARAHHGSVSREQRQQTEQALKAGRLPAVVATSSLELGIDMGAVDLVIQVEAPPSVSAGVQRVGRAGHHVGEISRGTLFPNHRGDLVPCAVVAQRMVNGQIEAIRYPRNALDVLAQQIVAMVAIEQWNVDELATLVRRAAPFAQLPDSALHGVLDMLSGRYPSDEFAELRPRLTWDRSTNILTTRSGAQRLAVTSGGTIPDRGLYGVFLADSDRPIRVGELDEEMVYESQVGDIFALGSSSWRITDITHDRVLVAPAPGEPAKPPFWKGDALGRPLELGRAIGAFLREITALPVQQAIAQMTSFGLEERAAKNVLSYLDDQKVATTYVPDDRTIVVERFKDELGDWRIAIHSVFGASVNAPWAMVLAGQLRERLKVDIQVLHTDDGIIMRLPDTTEFDPLRAESIALPANEVEALVTNEVGGSALFAARFRECAARALLLPRRNPGKRTPLWQQRQRSAQLLGVASEYASFPIVMEAMRECLHDVFDVPGLAELMRDIESRRIRLVETTTSAASPFARSLLFAYVAVFLYSQDVPLAERKAQALAVDSTMLSELLGHVELRGLLDAEVIDRIEAELQRLIKERHPRDIDTTHDLLRILGALNRTDLYERGVSEEWLAQLLASHRVLQVDIANEQRFIAVEDAARYRDALGIATPPEIPAVFTEPVADPLGDVMSRYARTHGPFTVSECAERFGLLISTVDSVLRRLETAGVMVSGEFRPNGTGLEWCEVEVLRTLRRRSLAVLRKEVEPITQQALGAFLPAWHGLGLGQQKGVDALADVLEQLQGTLLPASTWESLVLPSRVTDYQPAWLDELCSSGELLWAGAGSLPAGDGWLTFVFADTAAQLLPTVQEAAKTPLQQAIIDVLDNEQALFFRLLAEKVRAVEENVDDRAILHALWELVWMGELTNDTLVPIRASLDSIRASVPARRRGNRIGRPGRMRVMLPRQSGKLAGRWSRLPAREKNFTVQLHAQASALLERYGVVTKEAALAAGVPGGFASVYKVLSTLEESGRIRRGYFVESLGAAQFALPSAVEELRGVAKRLDMPPSGVLLAATDPANPYGAVLPWPKTDSEDQRPGRKAGAVVVLVNGALVTFVERGGRSVITFTADQAALRVAATELAAGVHTGRIPPLLIERVDGEPTSTSPFGAELVIAGFVPTPRGLRIRS